MIELAKQSGMKAVALMSDPRLYNKVDMIARDLTSIDIPTLELLFR